MIQEKKKGLDVKINFKIEQIPGNKKKNLCKSNKNTSHV